MSDPESEARPDHLIQLEAEHRFRSAHDGMMRVLADGESHPAERRQAIDNFIWHAVDIGNMDELVTLYAGPADMIGPGGVIDHVTFEEIEVYPVAADEYSITVMHPVTENEAQVMRVSHRDFAGFEIRFSAQYMAFRNTVGDTIIQTPADLSDHFQDVPRYMLKYGLMATTNYEDLSNQEACDAFYYDILTTNYTAMPEGSAVHFATADLLGYIEHVAAQMRPYMGSGDEALSEAARVVLHNFADKFNHHFTPKGQPHPIEVVQHLRDTISAIARDATPSKEHTDIVRHPLLAAFRAEFWQGLN